MLNRQRHLYGDIYGIAVEVAPACGKQSMISVVVAE
jgi:hypothetical protein